MIEDLHPYARQPWPCSKCHRLMVSKRTYYGHPRGREFQVAYSRELCVSCGCRNEEYRAARRKPDAAQQRPLTHVLEDWNWLDHDPTVSGAERIRQAAPRLGMKPKALEKALERAGVRA